VRGVATGQGPTESAGGPATLGHDRRNGLLAPFGVAAGHHDGGPATGEQLRGLPPYTRGCSGHQHTQIVQFHDNS
jgi:hypothetical protein